MSNINWLRLESNPEVINKFLEHLGISPKWGISDIISLDEELLQLVPRPVLAVLFLFPISQKYTDYCREQEEIAKAGDQDIDSNLYFMNQSIRNACGVVALIHAVANSRDYLKLDPKSIAGKFIENTKSLTPKEKAEMLEGSHEISSALVASTEPQQIESSGLEDKCPHFIALVQVNSKLYELDGRKTAPVPHGDTSSKTFLKDSARVCKQYMQRDPENVNFTALAFGAL